jgi:4-amino-4-deoxy-L-arabinose transferase-like glycosyltransferase
MSRTTSRALVAGACALYVLLHLVIVARSHIPWFDDTFFASVADTLRRTGEFRLTVSPLWFDKPVYLYGPTYFLLVAGVFTALGFGVRQYRLTGLLGACVLVVVAFRILRRVGVERRIALAACALMALDPIFLEILRVGRMDLLAVLFFLIAYLLLMDVRRVVITALDEKSETLSAYLHGAKLVPVGRRIGVPILSSLIKYPLWIRGHLIMWVVTTNYDGTIYKRVR